MDIRNGDFIITSTGVAEVLDINEEGKLEVSFIRPRESEANKIFKYDASNEWEEISKEAVTKHVEKPKDKFDYPKVFIELGLKPMGEHKGEEIFIKADADIETDEDLKKFQFQQMGLMQTMNKQMNTYLMVL